MLGSGGLEPRSGALTRRAASVGAKAGGHVLERRRSICDQSLPRAHGVHVGCFRFVFPPSRAAAPCLVTDERESTRTYKIKRNKKEKKKGEHLSNSRKLPFHDDASVHRQVLATRVIKGIPC